MPLTLVTGPANAAKAGAVLERLRALRSRDPLLVVPTSADVDHYRRELAAAGIVFGAEVLTFRRLVREIAAAAGLHGRPLGPVARDRVVRAAVRDTHLRVLAASARAPGFTAAAGDLFAELGRSMVAPARFTRALRGWAADGEAPAHAEELAALYSAYHRRLEALGRRDEQGHARAALDALRERPAAWGARPVLLYGFDDLDPLQLDAVETLAGRAGAEVWVALPYEPGRAAFAGHAATVELLKPLAERHVVLDDRSEHYAAPARRALHHLERRLFEGGGEPCPPNGAVRLLEAGGERAEAELVAAEVLELMREGVAPEDIAVLVREGGAAVEVLASGLADYGVPVAPDARLQLARTRLGAGVLAFARAALPGGMAADVIAWLRTPGKLADPDAADALDARARRSEAATAADARRLWEGRLDELDALAAAAAEGPAALLDALLAEAEAIWTAPHRRRAAVLGPEEAADARTAAELRGAARELRALAEADPELLAGGPEEVLEALAAVTVRQDAAHGGVLVAAAPAIRARRFRAVFVCGLQEGEFPRRPSPEPFLDDDARTSLARASGLVLRRHEDVLGVERHLFYACVSRPEEVLFLSFRSSDEDGDPVQPSPFVADVRALFTDELWRERGTRLLAEVTWPPATAPTPHELRRAQAAAQRVPEPSALAAPGVRRGARVVRRARARGRPRPGDVRRLRRALAGRVRAQAGARRAGPGADAQGLARPRRARGDAARAEGAHGLGAAGAGHARRGARRARRRARVGGARGPRPRALDRPRQGGAARARGGPRALPAPRGRVRRRDGAAVARVELRARGRPARCAPAQRLGLLGDGPRRPDRRRFRRPGRRDATTRARPSTPARAGRRTGGSRRRSTRWPRRSCSASRSPARSTSRSARATGARAGS